MNDHADDAPFNAEQQLGEDHASGGDLNDLLLVASRNPGRIFLPKNVARIVKLKASDEPSFAALRAGLQQAGCPVVALDAVLAKSSRGGARAPGQADVLIDLATTQAELFHSADGTAFAVVNVNGHRETWPLVSKGFANWLARQYYEATGGAPSSEPRKAALGVLEAMAIFDGPMREVFVRVGRLGEKLYLDLADEEWRAIEIDAEGWRVVEAPPVHFRRPAGLLPLPEPAKGGTIDGLRSFLNVRSEDDLILTVAWILAALKHGGPYPVLAVAGEQGSAKSTYCRLLRRITDPNTAPLRTLPRKEEELVIAANNGHILAFDNISELSPDMSDALCRVATGGGFGKRQLYTDADEVLIDVQRPVILNGIEDVVTRPDLASRAILLRLEPISHEQRRSEAEVETEFEEELPRLLGVLLEAMVHGLQHLSSVKRDRLPRLADFAIWIAACETALWPAGSFMAAYTKNADEAVEEVIDGNPVASAVREWMQRRPVWEGTATELLKSLEEIRPRETKLKSWPRNPRGLSGALRRAAAPLRGLGITVDFAREGAAGTRVVKLTRSPPQSDPAEFASVASVASETGSSRAEGFLMLPPPTHLTAVDDDRDRGAGRGKPLIRIATDATDATDAGFQEMEVGQLRLPLGTCPHCDDENIHGPYLPRGSAITGFTWRRAGWPRQFGKTALNGTNSTSLEGHQ